MVGNEAIEGQGPSLEGYVDCDKKPSFILNVLGQHRALVKGQSGIHVGSRPRMGQEEEQEDHMVGGNCTVGSVK